MEYLPIIILISLIVLLIAGAFLWNSRGLFLPDPELRQVKDIMEKVASECGYSDSLTIRRGKSFYTKDRKIIYVNLHKYKLGVPEHIIMKTLHEVAHCLNRDASEHGGVFQQIETKLIQKAKDLNFLTHDAIPFKYNKCLTVLKEENSEERASHNRLNYSLYFDPKTIY